MRPPWHPYAVLLASLLLPGAGHVLVGQPQRGLGFAFFTLLLMTFTWLTTTPDQSLVGRLAFGLFVWALSVPDAYRIARLNYERWRQSNAGAGQSPRATEKRYAA
jgi:hypothetical protein